MILPAFALPFLLTAAPSAEDLDRCRAIVDPAERLACYDALAEQAPPGVKPPSLLEERWELTPATEHGLFQFRFYRPNYLLPAVVSDDVNEVPESPTRQSTNPTPLPWKSVEAKFQLSFRTKVWKNLFGHNADLWVGYSHESFWQVYTAEASRPFRETNYEPELVLALPTSYDVAGLRGRLLGFGIVHQSNGRAEPLSRSWNRVYVLVGLERESFVLTLKPWFRVNEDASDDDNPDIVDYVGRGEVLAFWKLPKEHTLALRLRPTFEFSPSWGSAQLDWRFPVSRNSGGYVQAFTGHGESMIDYNFRKTSIGVGVVLGNWY
ncbi:MAG TPA: phospholipase A [Candidatus Polarisedimenticolaceae bacterium]|nr:phospholipase A [Candidatus Polarisedimenticolaceae bacterium]